MSSTEQIPLLMFPGIATDHRLLAAQRSEFPQLVVPVWNEPTTVGENATDYARRGAEHWTLGEQAILSVDQPYFLGGVSSGGVIALELAWYLHSLGKTPQGVLLLGSCRSWDAVPRWYSRWYQWSESLPKWFASKLFSTRHVVHSARSEGLDPSTRRLVSSMFLGTTWDQLRSSVRLLTTWRRDSVETARAPFPIHQLHGRQDSLIPPPSPEGATLLLTAGHWMCATHPQAVNNWMTAVFKDADLRLRRPGKRGVS
jgi:pimeloyl-ACP methyl ester carboxylesterase